MLRDWYHRLLRLLHLNRRDSAAILLSLLLAFTVWIISSLSQEYTGEVTVNVRAACGRLDGHMALSDDDHPVTARCRTSGFNLLRHGSRKYRQVREVEFDRSDLQHVEGNIYSISAEVLDKHLEGIFGQGISAATILTRSVSFNFPEESNRKVPVRWEGSLSYRSQYMPEGPLTMYPDSVYIYGEPRSLEGISYISTENRPFSDIDQTIEGTVRLKAPRGLRLSRDEITYSQEVCHYVELSSEVPVVVDHVPAGRTVKVFPSTAKVVLRCRFAPDSNPVRNITALHVDYKDFEASRQGKCIPNLDIRLPVSVLGFRTEPAVVTCVEMTSRK